MNISTDKPNPQQSIQEIFITSSVIGRVKIQYNSPLNYTNIIELNPSNNFQYVNRIMPRDLASPLNDRLNVAIVISSEMDISVQANKAETGTGDGYLALPITALSKTFFLASYSAFFPMKASFSIASPFNDTCISISYVRGNSGYRLMHLTLNANDVYHAGSLDFDYTGVFVSSSQPVAVYSGHSCAMVPVGTLFCDHLIEQVPPVTQWGMTFIMASFYGRPWAVGYRTRVVAQTDTNVTYTFQSFDANNKPSTWNIFRTVTLVRGEWDEASLVNITTTNAVVVMVNCSSDCLVMQYDPSFQVLNASGPGETALPDPFMVTVPALTHYPQNVRFSTSRHYKNGSDYECVNGITIVAKTADMSKIYLDGIPLASIGGTTFSINADGFSDYSVIIAPLKPGFHSVTSSDSYTYYAVFVYGYGTQDHTAYGYLGGYRYLYDKDQRLNATMPLFDFSLPVSAAPTEAPPTTPLPLGPTIVTEADTPYYVLRYVGRYYAFNLEGKLITKFCSDGYARYFLEKRLSSMKTKMMGMLSSKLCPLSGGASINVTFNNRIYSEYTAGVVEIEVKLKGVGSTSLGDIVRCVGPSGGNLLRFFERLDNWVDRYNNSRDVLKNDTSYTKDCNVVHFLPESFVNTGLGWACPKATEAVVSSSPPSLSSLSLICGALYVALMHSLSRFQGTSD